MSERETEICKICKRLKKRVEYIYLPLSSVPGTSHKLSKKLSFRNIKQSSQAHIIRENGRHFIREQLRPQDIYCYVYRLFTKYAERQYGTVEIRPG